MVNWIIQLPYFPMGFALAIMAIGIRVMAKPFLPVYRTKSDAAKSKSHLNVCLLTPAVEELVSLVYRLFLLFTHMPVPWLKVFFMVFWIIFIAKHPPGRRFCALLVGGFTSLLYWGFFTGAGMRWLSLTNVCELVQIAVVCLVCHILYNVVVVFFLATDEKTADK